RRGPVLLRVRLRRPGPDLGVHLQAGRPPHRHEPARRQRHHRPGAARPSRRHHRSRLPRLRSRPAPARRTSQEGPAVTSDLTSMTLPELRALAKEYGLPTSGTKTTLVDRITKARQEQDDDLPERSEEHTSELQSRENLV